MEIETVDKDKRSVTLRYYDSDKLSGVEEALTKAGFKVSRPGPAPWYTRLWRNVRRWVKGT